MIQMNKLRILGMILILLFLAGSAFVIISEVRKEEDQKRKEQEESPFKPIATYRGRNYSINALKFGEDTIYIAIANGTVSIGVK